MRVASLLPSATEILCAIGGSDLLVGRSHECDYPATITHVPVLTGQRTVAGPGRGASADIDRQVREAMTGGAGASSLYTLDAKRLAALAPDVILTQDLCDVCSIDLDAVRGVARELDPAPSIIALNPRSVEDVLDDVLRVGQAIGRETAAHETMVHLRDRYWTAVDYVNPYVHGAEVAFLEWMDPLFAGGHWTPQLIVAAGGRHSLNPAGATSRRIEPEDLVAAMPDRIIICPCGYDLDAIRRELPDLVAQRWWPLLPAVAEGHVALVDGSQMFNRPGPRLIDAFRWLVGWLNERPEVMPDGFPAEFDPS